MFGQLFINNKVCIEDHKTPYRGTSINHNNTCSNGSRLGRIPSIALVGLVALGIKKHIDSWRSLSHVSPSPLSMPLHITPQLQPVLIYLIVSMTILAIGSVTCVSPISGGKIKMPLLSITWSHTVVNSRDYVSFCFFFNNHIITLQPQDLLHLQGIVLDNQ